MKIIWCILFYSLACLVLLIFSHSHSHSHSHSQTVNWSPLTLIKIFKFRISGHTQTQITKLKLKNHFRLWCNNPKILKWFVHARFHAIIFLFALFPLFSIVLSHRRLCVCVFLVFSGALENLNVSAFVAYIFFSISISIHFLPFYLCGTQLHSLAVEAYHVNTPCLCHWSICRFEGDFRRIARYQTKRPQHKKKSTTNERTR